MTGIGIDVGGTKIGGAVVADGGTVLYSQTVATPRSPDGADPGAAATVAVLEHLEAQATGAGLQVHGAAIAVPEYVTPDGRINSRLVLAASADLPPSTRSGTAVLIDSDVRCAARAEYQLGQGGDYSSFVFVSIGTGISHTLVIDGRIWTGHRGEAIAVGELPVDPALVIRADAAPTVEQQASGRAIEQALPAEQLATRLDEIGADEIRARAGRIVAQALADLVHITDPAAVIIGGGLGSSTGPYTEALIHYFNVLTRHRRAAPALLQTRLGNQAGAIGAGLLVHQRSRLSQLSG